MISTVELGRAMASVLGHEAQVVLLRGHGNVVVGPTLQVAVFRAYSTQDSSFRPSCWAATQSFTWMKANVEPPTKS
jgi:Class II Aldolase and Adducin N-terminal domain